MGKLFKKSFGNTSFSNRFRKATPQERKKINSEETLEQAVKRQALSYFGRDYNSLSKSEKRYARQRAKDFRKNVYIDRDYHA